MSGYSFKDYDWLLRHTLLGFIFHMLDAFFTNVMLPQLTQIITGQVKCVISTFRNLSNYRQKYHPDLLIAAEQFFSSP